MLCDKEPVEKGLCKYAVFELLLAIRAQEKNSF